MSFDSEEDKAIERSMIREELRFIIDDFDIPAMRRPLVGANVRWMARNLQVRNSGHSDFARAMQLIKKLLKII